jgi:hypothetical protein
MIRRLLALVIVAALVYAGWNVGVAWSHYRKFQDDVRNVALFGNDKSDDDLKAQVMDLASRNQVPLEPEAVAVSRRAGEVTIEAHYSELVKIAPCYAHRFDFTVR